jgi:hypothetical protein
MRRDGSSLRPYGGGNGSVDVYEAGTTQDVSRFIKSGFGSPV